MCVRTCGRELVLGQAKGLSYPPDLSVGGCLCERSLTVSLDAIVFLSSFKLSWLETLMVLVSE